MAPLISIMLCLTAVALLIKPLGRYMALVYMGRSVWLSRPLGALERLIYRFGGIDSDQEMTAVQYLGAVLMLGVIGFFWLFALLMATTDVSTHMAFNIAASFITNTNWQSYSGEQALNYHVQMIGLAVQHFVSAATGMAVAVALCRGLARRKTDLIGNAWVDIVRGTLYILLPMAVIFALILASQGVVQTLTDQTTYTPLESGTEAVIALGPVASQTAIKMLGSNGGGYFNASGAHPFENPTALTNWLSLASILLMAVAFTHVYGIMAGDRRQGWAMLAAMTLLLLPFVTLSIANEDSLMEGKEVRFGEEHSALWGALTTATSNGSTNASHASFQPMSALSQLMLMQIGEVAFGGVGSGVYGMIIFILLTVFIAGLMVGRTPEYMGKKLEPFEIKMASLALLLPTSLTLVGTALAVSLDTGRASVLNEGAWGFTEILYAFTSAANNNGSSFAGLGAATPFYNITLGIIMLLARYGLIAVILMIAGSLAGKQIAPAGPGTLPTHTPLFVFMLMGVILLLGVLTYVPALALGPIAEYLSL